MKAGLHVAEASSAYPGGILIPRDRFSRLLGDPRASFSPDIVSHGRLAGSSVAAGRPALIQSPPPGAVKPQMRDILAALNPWWWVEGQDAGPNLADSASATRVGPGNGHWSDFPMPPPTHHGITSGVDHAPHTLSGLTAATLLYRQAGPTRDGRKSFGITNAGTHANEAGWAAGAGWANPDDPPIDGGNFDMVFWYKWTGRAPANNSQAGTATSAILGFSSQFATNAFWFWKDDRAANPGFNCCMRDSTNVLKTAGWGSSPNDGAWHLLGAKITCDGGLNEFCTLYDNGVSLGSQQLQANAGAFAGLSAEVHNFYLGEEPDFFIGTAAGFNLMDVAVTTATSASPGFSAANFAAMYAAR